MRALVRRPSPRLPEGIVAHIERVPVDYDLAVEVAANQRLGDLLLRAFGAADSWAKTLIAHPEYIDYLLDPEFIATGSSREQMLRRIEQWADHRADENGAGISSALARLRRFEALLTGLADIGRITERAKKLIAGNREMVHAFLDSRSDLRAPRLSFGTVIFPELLGTSVTALCDMLHEKYDTAVVPGSFFEMPSHFRIGIGCERQVLAEGLNRLGAALDELQV